MQTVSSITSCQTEKTRLVGFMCSQLTNETHQQYQRSESFGVTGLCFIATMTHQCAFMCGSYSYVLLFLLILLGERIMSIKKEGKK